MKSERNSIKIEIAKEEPEKLFKVHTVLGTIPLPQGEHLLGYEEYEIVTCKGRLNFRRDYRSII